MFKDKTLLITGGSGSFGKAILDRFTASDLKEIRIFSRDEKKQDDLRKKYNNPKIKFYIGDVRDFDAVLNATRGSDFIFHAAALKQVPSCEFYPLEAVKTNILGTENVLEASVISEVKKVICLSTDKAVYPINAMGISKSMMEKVAIAKSRISNKTTICCTRYGNVMASRGSVIPLFIDQIKSNHPLSITDPDMTRFMMTLEDAVDLVLFAFKKGKAGEIFVQKAPAANINVLSRALLSLFNMPDHPIKIIGTRHGEKLFETLLSREEMAVARDLGNFFMVPPDDRDLNYDKFFKEGKETITSASEYNSHNTVQLDEKAMQKLLTRLPDLKKVIEGTQKNLEE